MRRSQFTENEILHLLYEASAGVPVAEICGTAGVSLRTFYRWRRRFGGLNAAAVTEMKDLVAENIRLRGLVSNLVERLRAPAEHASPKPATSPTVPPVRDKAREQRRAIEIAAEKCGGALTGRFRAGQPLSGAEPSQAALFNQAWCPVFAAAVACLQSTVAVFSNPRSEKARCFFGQP